VGRETVTENMTSSNKQGHGLEGKPMQGKGNKENKEK